MSMVLPLYIKGKMVDKRNETLELLFAQVRIHMPTNISTGKRLAIERYMRTYLRALLDSELEFELKYVYANGTISPDLEYKIDQAAKGYDWFMSKRHPKRK